MAKARTEVVKVEKVVTVEEKVTTLQLSQNEVEALYYVLVNIGGSTIDSPRGYCDAILNAIRGKVGGKFSINGALKVIDCGNTPSLTWADYDEIERKCYQE